MEAAPGTIVHFEIPANDVEKLATFYRQLFGWKVEKTPGPMDYWLVETSPQGGGVNGGMMKRQMPNQTPLNYVLVASVAEASGRVQALGGQVVMPKSPVPQQGYFAVALDPDGNPIGLWEDDPNAA